MKKMILFLVLVSVLVLSGCGTPYQQLKGEDVFKEEQVVSCNRPYILVGTSCCLDQNDNAICDKDETQTKEELETEQTTSEVSEGFTKEFSKSISEDTLSKTEKAELLFVAHCKDTNKIGVLDVYVNELMLSSFIPNCEKLYEQQIPFSSLKENNKIIFKSHKGEYEVEYNTRLSLKETCSDECSSDTCDGFDYIACLKKSDGCKDKENQGKVKGKCGVECEMDSDCGSNEECKSYVCVEVCYHEEVWHYCDGNNLMKRVKDTNCEITESLVEVCPCGCEVGDPPGVVDRCFTVCEE